MDDDGRDDDEQGEESKMKPRPKPRGPSAAERAQHEIDHYPYRSWCKACVGSCGRADQHIRTDSQQNAYP
eukprot:6285240-Karenia_brevis.AAC.1